MAYQIETTCICGDPETSKNHSFGAVSVPIYQTATFAHPGIGESTGHNYTRESNPTRDELEKTVSALEGAVDTVACTSGMAAISLMMELFDSGSHFVCTEDLYGGSVRIFEALEKKRGFSFSYVNTADVEAVEKAITDQTKALYIETPSNPTMPGDRSGRNEPSGDEARTASDRGQYLPVPVSAESDRAGRGSGCPQRHEVFRRSQ